MLLHKPSAQENWQLYGTSVRVLLNLPKMHLLEYLPFLTPIRLDRSIICRETKSVTAPGKGFRSHGRAHCHQSLSLLPQESQRPVLRLKCLLQTTFSHSGFLRKTQVIIHILTDALGINNTRETIFHGQSEWGPSQKNDKNINMWHFCWSGYSNYRAKPLK